MAGRIQFLTMSREEYIAARELRGSQAQVAKMLEVATSTIADRERGVRKITREASLAIQALPEKGSTKKPKEKE